MARATLRFWAAARDAAGVAEEPVEGETLADLLAVAAERHGPRLAQVLGVCSFLVDEVPVGGRDPAGVSVPDGAVVEALPPFAGGAR